MPYAALQSGLVVADPAGKKTAMGRNVMTTRRNFLKGGSAAVATSIVFCSCGLLQSAHAQQASRQKLPVMVNGKRVKTIDVHAHCLFPEAGKLLGEAGSAPSPVRGADEAVIALDKRLRPPEGDGGGLGGASVNPQWVHPC